MFDILLHPVQRFSRLACHALCVLAFTAQSALAAINIPLLGAEQLAADYWQNKLSDKQEVIMNRASINAFNQQLFASNEHMYQPLTQPAQLDADSLIEAINSISSVPQSPRFYADGRQLSTADFNAYRDNLNLEGVATSNPVTYGLIVKRSVLRTFPTLDRVFNQQMDLDLDRFQESGVFPGEAVAILHHSKDKKWLLVRNYNYTAWMPSADVAIGDKAAIAQFIDAQDFIVVTGAKVLTTYVPDQPDVSELQLDMGVKLPLVAAADQQAELYQHNTAASYQVMLPTRNAQGQLQFKSALIGRSQDVHQGYLPLTADNLISQAFKFLGERYGWGHDYNGRDCTGFVGEIYKSFGLLMPRNSGQQGSSDYGTNWRFAKDASNAAKLAVIEKLQVGDLIYIPGHVMMYLGDNQGQPFVIHDVKGLGYWQADGEFYSGVLNGVSVTPLLPLQLNPTTSYVDRIYNIKRLVQSSVGNHQP